MGSTSSAVWRSSGSVHVVRFNPPAVALSRFAQLFGTSIVKIDPFEGTKLDGTLAAVVPARVAVVGPAGDRSLEEPPPLLSGTTATITATPTTPMRPGST